MFGVSGHHVEQGVAKVRVRYLNPIKCETKATVGALGEHLQLFT